MKLNNLELASPHNTGSPDVPSYTSALLEDHPEYPEAGGLRQDERGTFSKLNKLNPVP
jgi:hypothetical protein